MIETLESEMLVSFASLVSILFTFQASNLVNAHGTMIDPVSRNSLWRVDKSVPVNYNDIELFCGGIGVSNSSI